MFPARPVTGGIGGSIISSLPRFTPSPALGATSNMSRPTTVWIDCDAGVDDAHGLVLVLAAPHVQVLGISCVAGNAHLQQVYKNVARVLKLMHRTDIPVYLGAPEPLMGFAMPPTDYHGEDGLGARPDVYPTPQESIAEVAPREEVAAAALVECARRNEGDLVLIATGPLTNIALATKLDPSFPSRVSRLYVMGGNEGRGNVTPSAEYNMYFDAEAAAIVFGRWRGVHMVTWDAAKQNTLPWSFVDRLMEKPTPAARFCSAIMDEIAVKDRAEHGTGGWIVCDPLCMAAAVYPELVTKACEANCQIEVQGKSTRGASSITRRRAQGTGAGTAPLGGGMGGNNVVLLDQMDMAKFQDLFDRSTD